MLHRPFQSLVVCTLNSSVELHLPEGYLDACQLLEDTYAPVNLAVEARQKVKTEKQKEEQSFAKFVKENQGYYTRSGFTAWH